MRNWAGPPAYRAVITSPLLETGSITSRRSRAASPHVATRAARQTLHKASFLSVMLPNSGPASRTTRTIHVAAGRAYTRVINSPVDPNDKPIVERMTRSRLDKMSAGQVKRWKNEQIGAILELSPRKKERESIAMFFNARSSGEAGPSGTAPGGSMSSDVPPASTPGKWFGKKKTDSARKRGQKRTMTAFSTSPTKYMGNVDEL